MDRAQWLALAIVSLLAAAALVLLDRLRRRRDEAQAYLKGVRSMLAGDPDSAIEALSDAARLASPEAVETYLALGALFRRTGDLARAVRLHKNMLKRPGLDPARQLEIERELADDYRRGGMLAESAAAYRGLSARGDRRSNEALRDVLIEQGDLCGAAAVQRGLSAATPDPLLAHLYAGQARELLACEPQRAHARAVEALAAAPLSPDALLATAEVAAAEGDDATALEHVESALDVDPRCALLAWPALSRCGDAAGAERMVARRTCGAPSDGALHYLVGRLLHRQGRIPEALAALDRALDHDDTGEVTLAMRDLLRDAEAPGPGELAARHDLLVKALLRKPRPARCRRCGAGSAMRVWRCPGCGAFDAYA